MRPGYALCFTVAWLLPAAAGAGVAARALPPSASTPRVSQKFILDCDPPAECVNPTRNNEPCKAVPVPFFQHPPLRLSPAVRLSPGHPDGSGEVLSDVMLRRDIVDALDSAGAFPRRFVVNFGAWLQRETQPLWYDAATGVMLRRGWAGMAFDSAEHLEVLRRRVKLEGREHNITLHPVLLSADNVVSYLEKNADPEDLRQMGFLKVDVDSIDCDLAEAILRAGYRPVLLHIEFDPHWPVGLRVRHRNSRLGDGCSCAAAAELGRRYGYRLVSAFGIDATMVRDDVLQRISPKLRFETAAYCSPSCGSAYCRPWPGVCAAFADKWLEMARRREWDEMVRHTVKEVAARRFAGVISHDFSGLSFVVSPDGRIQQVGSGSPELVADGRYAVPRNSS
eukprot:TRINITY_DN2755_c0_g1_i3.p1 TRINITY_DN2755_c0_g1~~TRINITY_DN2755_c0_g1_i3.p1  ORF type:complete len:427 (+),score=116.01 TRINITY_DN2755_c0_g1_i3:100-1281(+)